MNISCDSTCMASQKPCQHHCAEIRYFTRADGHQPADIATACGPRWPNPANAAGFTRGYAVAWIKAGCASACVARSSIDMTFQYAVRIHGLANTANIAIYGTNHADACACARIGTLPAVPSLKAMHAMRVAGVHAHEGADIVRRWADAARDTETVRVER
jgi:hypothetical protein